MAQEIRHFRTNVFKASLDLGSQSVDEFTNDIRADLGKIYSSAEWLWISQLYGDRVIVAVEYDNTFETKWFEHAYTRTLSSGFEFGEAAEVEPRTTFVRV